MCLSAHIFFTSVSSCLCLVRAYVCGLHHAIVHIFLHQALGFWVVFSSYCLLEQIEGVKLSCVDTIFSGVIKSRSILFK